MDPSSPHLDVFTLNVVTVCSLLLAAGGLLTVSRLNRDVHGLKRCFAACLLMLTGYALSPLRAAFPNNRLTLLTNIPLFLGAIFLVDGVRAFRELPRRRAAYLLAGLAYLLFFAWFFLVADSPGTRLVLRGIFTSGLSLIVAAAMAWKVPPRDRAVYWSTAALFTATAIVTLLRAFTGHSVDPFVERQLTPVEILHLAVLNVTILGGSFGLGMAANLRLQRQTETLAYYDSLTRLPNRRFFEERLEQAEERARRTGRRVALIYCDIDGFKAINDSLGHEGGDRALRVLAERLRALLSAETTLARVGGDEFVVLFNDAPDRDVLLKLIDRLRKGTEGDFSDRGRTVQLRLSCGLALFPDDVGSASDLLRLADAGMYMMKQDGRFPSSRTPRHA